MQNLFRGIDCAGFRGGTYASHHFTTNTLCSSRVRDVSTAVFVHEGYRSAEWVCTHYANWAAEEMDGYAFGVAREGNHRLNIHLVDDNGEIRIAHYDPQRCEWGYANIDQVVISSSRNNRSASGKIYASVN